MAAEEIKARYQLKDSDGPMVDEEGKAVMEECVVNFDFGDDLNAAVDICGEEAVHSNYRANGKVQLQSIIRAKLKAGLNQDAIQALVDTWKPGMVMEKTAVDPAKAVISAFGSWSDEKKAEFLKSLDIEE